MTIPVGDRYMTHVEWAEGQTSEDMPPLMPLAALLIGSSGFYVVQALAAARAVSERPSAFASLSGSGWTWPTAWFTSLTR